MSVSSIGFSATSGSIETLDANNTLFSVYSSDSVPSGTFTLTLAAAVSLSLLSIDISAMASSPTIEVSVSENGLSWTEAAGVSISGYRLNAWLPHTAAKYIQIGMTPSHPDNLGGDTYTFGITNVSGASVDYNLVSDLVFEPVWFPVRSSSLRLVADADPRFTYYLTLSDGVTSRVAQVVNPGDVIPLVQVFATMAGASSTAGVLSAAIPGTVIPGTVEVIGAAFGNELPVVPGLSATDPNIGSLLNPHVSLVGGVLTVLPHPPDTTDYTVKYLTGPAALTAALRVHLSTADPAVTPVFSGAYLEEI